MGWGGAEGLKGRRRTAPGKKAEGPQGQGWVLRDGPWSRFKGKAVFRVGIGLECCPLVGRTRRYRFRDRRLFEAKQAGLVGERRVSRRHSPS